MLLYCESSIGGGGRGDKWIKDRHGDFTHLALLYRLSKIYQEKQTQSYEGKFSVEIISFFMLVLFHFRFMCISYFRPFTHMADFTKFGDNFPILV